jgi:hypothetical protein
MSDSTSPFDSIHEPRPSALWTAEFIYDNEEMVPFAASIENSHDLSMQASPDGIRNIQIEKLSIKNTGPEADDHILIDFVFRKGGEEHTNPESFFLLSAFNLLAWHEAKGIASNGLRRAILKTFARPRSENDLGNSYCRDMTEAMVAFQGVFKALRNAKPEDFLD